MPWREKARSTPSAVTPSASTTTGRCDLRSRTANRAIAEFTIPHPDSLQLTDQRPELRSGVSRRSPYRTLRCDGKSIAPRTHSLHRLAELVREHGAPERLPVDAHLGGRERHGRLPHARSGGSTLA